MGANGSGKSNFLGALKLLRTAVLSMNQMADDVVRAGGADRLLHFGSKTTPTMRFRVKFTDALTDFCIDMRHGADDRLFPRISVAETELPADFMEHLVPRPGVAPLLEFLRYRIEHWRLYHFHDTSSSSPIKKTADLHDNRRLRPDGSNLAAFLYLLRKKHEGAYTQIRNTIRLTAPFFEDFSMEPLELNEDKIRLEWRHVGSDAYFDASSLSDGSLRFITLATLLLQPASLRPPVVLLDEPELGLHPFAITLLASMLKHAAVESQIIVATQSPVLLDHFDPEDVIVADRVNGATKLNRLGDDKLRSWLDDYSLGELWEKNELGGRPVPERTDRKSSE
ncbi:MAG: AAA family ATPase [Gammaproteobacteria bacterium]|nr:AAA family ATPase [Gammaproteobacteria bacterium]